MPSICRPAALAAAALLLASGVQAHMPYVLPSIFDVGQRGHILVQASFTEDAFVPDIAMRDAPFHLIAPDGQQGAVGPVSYLRDVSVFEADLKAEGTYRLTSGQRLGRKGRMYKDGDQWKMGGEGGRTPAGVELVEVQSTTLAEAYVTRGRPSDAALKPYGVALEIQALTHPNGLSVGADATFRVLFDGAPLAGLEVTVFRSAGVYDGRKVAAKATTDAGGGFAFRPEGAGTYLVLVRHRAAAPAGAETPYRSYTYTLAFDAI
ncbi:putative GH25 family protein [Stella humosa]|uniref:Putative GH25 family protein n=1 Tax=Stella humosa TaxID=94 RepID=A0A3N1MCG9_9PROT|nr:DUF4198 domain-containing protein [Stella humosa]ROQ01421.1 putative GH25 family protein [Stella humosa]BBK31797.1 hypothetical protein STHU_24310 [Stella humosa]